MMLKASHIQASVLLIILTALGSSFPNQTRQHHIFQLGQPRPANCDFFIELPRSMTKEEIISKVKTLNLPKNSYVVFGSCPLAVAGIRRANDIDLLVSEEVFAELKQSGWQELVKSPNDKPLVHDVFEAHNTWNFSSYSPTLEHLLSTATLVEDIPFASLKEVRKWKASSERPNDFVDIGLIDKYLETDAFYVKTEKIKS